LGLYGLIHLTWLAWRSLGSRNVCGIGSASAYWRIIRGFLSNYLLSIRQHFLLIGLLKTSVIRHDEPTPEPFVITRGTVY
jgi:hypothetical protein